MVYFLESEPASKIIDWKSYATSSNSKLDTLLEIGLDEIASDIGIGADEPVFYDFRNPSATHMMIVADFTVNNEYDQFTIQLPSSNEYKEVSWGIFNAPGGCCSDLSYLKIAEQQIDGSVLRNGLIGFASIGDLETNTDVLIEMNNPSGLVIVYREK